MAKVTGIGGVFFKAADIETTKAWYRDNLGVELGDYGKTFAYSEGGDDAFAVFSAFKSTTDYLDPSPHPVMINLRVDDLDAMQSSLAAKGIEVLGRQDDEDFGKFAWILDPNGIKLELWQQTGPAPPA